MPAAHQENFPTKENLQGLWLSDNELTGSIPFQLGNLGNLQYLWLYDNQLTGSIPQSVLDLQANLRLENPPYVKTEISDVSASLGKNFNLDLRGNFGDINNNINGYSASGSGLNHQLRRSYQRCPYYQGHLYSHGNRLRPVGKSSRRYL